jgi:hypothetical protein
VGKKAAEYTAISARKGIQKWIQALASAWDIPEDQVSECLVRAGLEAHLAEQRENGGRQRQDK